MTESSDPKDNAQAERINNTMKNELLKDKVFRSIEEVIAAVALAVDFYNNRRPHMNIGMMTPAEAAESTRDRNMRWTSYMLLAIKNRDNLEIPENSLSLNNCQGPPSSAARVVVEVGRRNAVGRSQEEMGFSAAAS